MRTSVNRWLPLAIVASTVLALMVLTAPRTEGQGAFTINRYTGIEVTGGRFPVLAELEHPSAITARNNAMVEGGVANDADLTALYPLAIGCKASIAVPGAVSADGDSVFVRCSRTGAIQTISSAGTSTPANISDAATSAALFASNAARLGAMCWNDSPSTLYIQYGATASATSFVKKVPPDGEWEMPFIYTGVINGIWSSDASGAARCTELTQ